MTKGCLWGWRDAQGGEGIALKFTQIDTLATHRAKMVSGGSKVVGAQGAKIARGGPTMVPEWISVVLNLCQNGSKHGVSKWGLPA